MLSAVLLSALSVLTIATGMPSSSSAPVPSAAVLGYQVFLPVLYKAFFPFNGHLYLEVLGPNTFVKCIKKSRVSVVQIW